MVTHGALLASYPSAECPASAGSLLIFAQSGDPVVNAGLGAAEFIVGLANLANSGAGATSPCRRAGLRSTP